VRRAAAVFAGLLAASVGYVQGTVAHKRRQASLGPAPTIAWAAHLRD
jgi:hypothetical protein